MIFSLTPALLFSTGGCHNLSFGYACFLFIVWVSVLFVHLWRFLSFSSHCFMGLISPWPIPSLWGRREGGIPTPFCFALYTRIVKPLLQVVYFIQFSSIVDCVFSTGLLNEYLILETYSTCFLVWPSLLLLILKVILFAVYHHNLLSSSILKLLHVLIVQLAKDTERSVL